MSILTENAHAGLYCYNLTDCAVSDNSVLYNGTISNSLGTLYVNGGSNTSFTGNSVVGNINVGSAAGTGNVFDNNPGVNPLGNITVTMPASGTAYTNSNAANAMVCITGGTVSAISIDGTSTGLTSGTFFVPVNATIAITYTSAPSWTWFLA